MGSTTSSKSLLYKYVTIEGLKRILEGSIRFTQPSAFNDPFELLPEIIVPANEMERQVNVSFDIRAPRQSQTTFEQREPIPEVCTSSDAMSREIVQQLNQSIGFLSLSEVKDSLLMWAHYADQYSGAVVAFDGAHDFFTDKIAIEYRSSRPRRYLRDYLAEKPIPVAEICVKSDQWAYEKEVRIVRMLAECEQNGFDSRNFPVFVQRIPLGSIESVVLGE